MCQTYDVCFLFNLGNKNLRIYHHFSLILCYFWRQNCLKTSILALWATLVNTCWPYVCDRTKWSLGACKYLSQVPSPQISRQEIQNSSRGVEKTIFLCLQAVDGITTFKLTFCKHTKAQKIWIWRWLFHQPAVGGKNVFFDPPVMSFAFLDMIFGRKGLEIDTYKPPKCIWSYHIHVVNTRSPKRSREIKLTF